MIYMQCYYQKCHRYVVHPHLPIEPQSQDPRKKPVFGFFTNKLRTKAVIDNCAYFYKSCWMALLVFAGMQVCRCLTLTTPNHWDERLNSNLKMT